MKRLSFVRNLAIAWLTTVLVAPLLAGDFSFSGRFTQDDNRRVFTFTVAQPRTVTVRTLSYGGGVTASGVTVAPGGFDTSLFLFDGTGALVGQNGDGGCAHTAADPVTGQCWDAWLQLPLVPGTYQLVLAQYDAAPFGPSLSDGFLRDATGNFTRPAPGAAPSPFWDITPNQRTSAWAIDILGADSALLSQSIGVPAAVLAAGGSAQGAVVATNFSTALRAQVVDSGGNPVSGVRVTFTVPSTGAGAAFNSNGYAYSDGSGYATAPDLTANTAAGSYTVSAAADGISAPAYFSLTNVAGAPARIDALAGTLQNSIVYRAFSTLLQVAVQDAYGNPAPGVVVNFAAPSSGSGGTFASSSLVQTNSAGIATAPALTANGTEGSFTVTATAGAVSAAFRLTNLPAPKSDQTLAFGPLPDRAFGDAPFSVSATASSNLPVTFQIVSGPATISGSTVTLTGPGTVVIRASQQGSSEFNPAPNAEQSFRVNRGVQTIAFGPLPDRAFGDAPFSLTATATSGLTVAFEVVSGPAAVSGKTVTLTGAGPVVVRASQAGNTSFNPAASVDQAFMVSKGNQTITFATLPNRVFGDAPFTLAATAASGLPVTFHIVSGPATVDGSTLTLTGAGAVIVRASQAGNANYNPAADVDRSLTVGRAAQTIAFGPLSDRGFGSSFQLGATATSGLPVLFQIVSGPAAIAGNAVTVSGIGAVTVRASQPGNANFNPAADIEQTFNAIAGVQSIAFGPLPERTVGDPAFAVEATASSGLPVLFTVSGPATISGNSITVTGAGYVSVIASQPGDGRYAPAVSISQAFRVNPSAAPVVPIFILEPLSSSFSAAAGTATIALTSVPSTAPWSAVSNAPWIHITSGTEGPGNGTILYTVDANPSSTPRQGSMAIAGLTFTVTQASAAACLFTLNPDSLALNSGATSGTLGVQASADSCTWTATASAPWISVNRGSGAGNGAVAISVAANPGPGARSGSLTIGSQTVAITQEGPCAVSLGSSEANLGDVGGSGVVTVSAFTSGGSGCGYTTTAPPNWITVTAGGTGTGAGTLTYRVWPNSSIQPRSAYLVIGDQPFQVTQQGTACTVSLIAGNSTVGAAGGGGSIAVQTNDPSCAWSASANADWVTLGAATSGVGSGTLSYTVAANTVPTSRGAAVTVASQSVRLIQDGAACTYQLRSTVGSVPAGGGRASVGVVAASACGWDVSSGADWLSVPSGSSASGTADVTYEAAPNPLATSRTGIITIAGTPFAVSQAGSGCTYSLASTSAHLSAEAAASSFDFTASSSGCTPEVASANIWIAVSGAPSTENTGTVRFNVDRHTGSAARSGVINVGDQSFRITQDPPACAYTLLSYSARLSRLGGPGSLRFQVRGGESCIPAITADPGVTLGSLSGSNGQFTLPYTVPAFSTFDSGGRVLTVTVGNQVFKIKQSSW